MDYNYQYGNKYYTYYDKYGIEHTLYKKLAPEQSQDVQPG